MPWKTWFHRKKKNWHSILHKTVLSHLNSGLVFEYYKACEISKYFSCSSLTEYSIPCSVHQQVTVLKCVWNELLTLRLAFRPSPVEDALVLGTGQLLRRDQGEPGLRRWVGRFLDEIVAPCKAMNLEMAELVCMKALVLFNPGVYACMLYILVEALLFIYMYVHFQGTEKEFSCAMLCIFNTFQWGWNEYVEYPGTWFLQESNFPMASIWIFDCRLFLICTKLDLYY